MRYENFLPSESPFSVRARSVSSICHIQLSVEFDVVWHNIMVNDNSFQHQQASLLLCSALRFLEHEFVSSIFSNTTIICLVLECF